MNTTLHYVYDPYCGWCYGVSPLVSAAHEVPGLTLEIHAGGMLTGERRRPVSEAFRNYIVQSDQRIHAMTGQPFGDTYSNGLLSNPDVIFDSEPPIIAILAAQELANKDLDMLRQLQKAHYVEGRDMTSMEVLNSLAVALGLDPVKFAEKMQSIGHMGFLAHTSRSNNLLAQMGGTGYPCFILEKKDSQETINHGPYLGKSDAWIEMLKAKVAM